MTIIDCLPLRQRTTFRPLSLSMSLSGVPRCDWLITERSVVPTVSLKPRLLIRARWSTRRRCADRDAFMRADLRCRDYISVADPVRSGAASISRSHPLRRGREADQAAGGRCSCRSQSPLDCLPNPVSPSRIDRGIDAGMVSPNAFAFRLQGCPTSIHKGALRERISAAFGDITPNDIRIHSLVTAL